MLKPEANTNKVVVPVRKKFLAKKNTCQKKVFPISLNCRRLKSKKKWKGSLVSRKYSIKRKSEVILGL